MKRFLVVLLVIVAGLATFHLVFPEREFAFARDLARHAAKLTEKALELGDMHVAYLDGGQGEPLLLIHGFGADKDVWAPVSRYLTDRFHVIAIDVPGFGESSRPLDWRYRIQDQVERVHQIAVALQLQRFHIGGNSMGGYISAVYAAKYPGDLASLWLLDPGGLATAEKSEMAKAVESGTPTPLLVRSRADLDALMSWVYARPPFVPSSFKNIFAARAAADYELRKHILHDIREESPTLEQLLPGVNVPMHIVWGAADRVVRPSGATVLAGLLPKATITIFPDVGHVPIIEQPKATADDYKNVRDSL